MVNGTILVDNVPKGNNIRVGLYTVAGRLISEIRSKNGEKIVKISLRKKAIANGLYVVQVRHGDKMLKSDPLVLTGI
jgi:hypothetical protein